MIDWDSVIFFVSVSLPEQLLMASFAWLLLGKLEKVRLLNVFGVGVVAAVLFYIVKSLASSSFYSVLPQFVIFIVLICIAYRLNFIETIIGSLVTLVVLV